MQTINQHIPVYNGKNLHILVCGDITDMSGRNSFLLISTEKQKTALYESKTFFEERIVQIINTWFSNSNMNGIQFTFEFYLHPKMKTSISVNLDEEFLIS